MKKLSRTYFIALALALLAFAGCSRRAKVIPRGTMAKIYADIFMQDQWLTKHPQGLKADTTLIYEPIFRKYGFTSADYRLSRETYINDPDRYSRILKNSNMILDRRVKELEEKIKMRDEIKARIEAMKVYRPDKIFSFSGLSNPDTFVEDSVIFYVDTTGGEWSFDPEKGLDTVYSGPKMIINLPDSLIAHLDSLAAAKADSLSKALSKLQQND